MTTEHPVEYTLALTEEERTELLRLLESSLVDVHAERRRTEAPDYQEQIHRQECLLRTLTEKVRRLRR
jgi:hypothetical protein